MTIGAKVHLLIYSMTDLVEKKGVMDDLFAKYLPDLRTGKEIELKKTASQLDYEKVLDQYKHTFDRTWARKTEPSKTPTGFEMFTTLGSGAFGQVVLVKHRPTSMYFAMKILEKALIIKTKQVLHTLNEKRILTAISYPFVVSMEFVFKDNSYIYFVMPFINGGDMFTHLKKMRKFKEDMCKFYAAQVVLALEYLHYLHLVYRDLKPENIMIDNEGYVKITDFGFCKYVRSRTWSLCGTPDYLAPEIILSKGYGQSVDWWSFGVLVYEMAAGYAPFYDRDQMTMYEKIVTLRYRYPPDFGIEIKDLIRNLLQVDLSRRYGILKKGVYDIKNHLFFKDTNWWSIYQRTEKPPFVPKCKDPSDTRNFDAQEEVVINVDVVNRYEREFRDF